ncbi:hypothetical protein BGW38_003129 [Lunasporangiospora selenospora]|uniref:Cation/H+ exchanger transmembrane domain-containing protein n=1 Tax=Lunasporangiospora selenospora TaxID=979761 RepID=A0A9P6KD23_9FUNG|nr:hypothetical protein BGW38_003129 [Lunasporangiospora selenospora]
MWATSALLIWGMIPGLGFLEAMVIGACVTPTDPVLSNSVVKGRFAEKHVPPRIRYLLSAESGVNDGMGLPFLFLGLYLLKETNPGTAVAKWFYLVWAYQILLSVVLGGLIGAAARKLVKGAKNRNLIDKESFLVFSIALALAVTGIVSILASDDLLACFVAGNVFAWDDWFSNEIAEAHIQEIIDMLLNLACFVYIGASIPFASFGDSALQLTVWRLVVLAILILVFRRLPFMLGLKPLIPALTSYREAAFAGWFGPVGVGAVFFTKVTALMTSPEHLGEDPHNADRLNRVREVIFPVVMFLVLSSVLIHGITVPLLHLQYKYTRTWSRKREDSNHAVTRLPHINIGDEIILRPPTISGSSIGGAGGDGNGNGDQEQRTIGYDNQRSIGFDNQRSIGFDNQRSVGYDHQRSVNGRSLGYGTLPYKAFGIAGVPDLSNPSTPTRTLQDVVQEMKEASASSRGNRNWRSSMLSPSTPHSRNESLGGGALISSEEAASNERMNASTVPRDGMSISFEVPRKEMKERSKDMGDSDNGSASSTSSTSAKEIAEAMKRDHPSIHSSPLPPPRTVDSGSIYNGHGDGDNSQDSSSVTAVSGHALSPLPAARSGSRTELHEVEREEDRGLVRTVSHDVDVNGRDHITVGQHRRESSEGGNSHYGQRRSEEGRGARPSAGHHLGDLFRPHQ